MNSKQLEEAKQIARTIYPQIDLNHTFVYFMPGKSKEMPLPPNAESMTEEIVHRGGYKFCYFAEVDKLFVGISDPKESMFI